MLVKISTIKTPLFVASVAVLLLIIVAAQLFSERKNNIADANTFKKLTLDDADQIKGYTCGFFTLEKAEKFLKTEVTQNFTNYTLSSNKGTLMALRHYDSCMYESKTSSAVYAQFFIETYDNKQAAADNFESHLPLVANPKEKLGFISDADRITYDAGVYYILIGRQVVQVAASNGTPSQSEEYAGELLRNLSAGL